MTTKEKPSAAVRQVLMTPSTEKPRAAAAPAIAARTPTKRDKMLASAATVREETRTKEAETNLLANTQAAEIHRMQEQDLEGVQARLENRPSRNVAAGQKEQPAGKPVDPLEAAKQERDQARQRVEAALKRLESHPLYATDKEAQKLAHRTRDELREMDRAFAFPYGSSVTKAPPIQESLGKIKSAIQERRAAKAAAEEPGISDYQAQQARMSELARKVEAKAERMGPANARQPGRAGSAQLPADVDRPTIQRERY
jgi:hypothetical protein